MSDVVLFSGGCDSTLVLYRRAIEALKTNSYNRVKALSIIHDQVPAQEKQKQAREAVRKEFEARQLPIDWLEVNITQSKGTGVCSDGLTQPVIWFVFSVMYTTKDDCLYPGYHKGDDYWMRRYEIEAAFHNMCVTMEKPNVSIKYELCDFYKRDVIQELKNRNLYDLCWYCEYPTSSGTPCGNCIPCFTHRTALWQIENIPNIIGGLNLTPAKNDSVVCAADVQAIQGHDIVKCADVKECIEVGPEIVKGSS